MSLSKDAKGEIECVINENLDQLSGDIVNLIAESLLNYLNHKKELGSAIASAMLDSSEANAVLYTDKPIDMSWMVYQYEEQYDTDRYDIGTILEKQLIKLITSHWKEIIARRLEIESSFEFEHEFIALRRFIVVLSANNFRFYTKDTYGGGMDVIETGIYNDSIESGDFIVHSTYESFNEIIENFDALNRFPFMGHELPKYGFANLSHAIIHKDRGVEFFGPDYAHDIYSSLNEADKRSCAEMISELASDLSLPAEININWKPGEDKFMFDVMWQRRLPEIFHKISNHTSARTSFF